MSEFVPPSGQWQEIVAEVWGDVFGVARIGGRDDFFSLGGSSLVALKVLARLRERTDRDIQLFDVFEHSLMSKFAEVLERAPVRARDSRILSRNHGGPGASPK